MTPLHLDATELTPEIHLDPVGSTLLIRGECFPENPVLFFGQLFAALQLHLDRPDVGQFEAVVRLRYVNSASTKALRRLLARIDAAAARGISARVVWEHEADDETMAELGRDLAEDLRHLHLVPRTCELAA